MGNKAATPPYEAELVVGGGGAVVLVVGGGGLAMTSMESFWPPEQ